MIPLYERRRPERWEEVVGQPGAVALLRGMAAEGLGGNALWIQGQSGTGKTTLAKLAAAEVADPLCVEEVTAGALTRTDLKDIIRKSQYRGLGVRTGRVWIVNEAHRIRDEVLGDLLDALESVPTHVLWIFTTTNDGAGLLFEGNQDAAPLIGRCTVVALARQGLAKPFADYLARIDPGEKRTPAEYMKLIQRHKNSLRWAIQELAADATAAKFAEAVEMVGAA